MRLSIFFIFFSSSLLPIPGYSDVGENKISENVKNINSVQVKLKITLEIVPGSTRYSSAIIVENNILQVLKSSSHEIEQSSQETSIQIYRMGFPSLAMVPM